MNKITRFIAITLAVSLLCACLTVCTSASTVKYSGNCGAYVKWALTDDGVLTISGNGDMYDYGNSFVKHTSSPWEDFTSIKTVIVEDGVTSISYHAFDGIKTITNIELGKDVKTIHESAFSGCTNLTSINIPSGVTYIGKSAFYNCKKLGNIVLPEGLTTIGETAFYNCDGMTTINIPSSVTIIGGQAFCASSNLESFEVAVNNSKFADVDGALLSKDLTTLISYPAGRTDALYEMPISVTAVKDSAFYGAKFKGVKLADGLTSIGEWAFAYCYDLLDIVIPNSVTSIGNYAFWDCESLKSITVGLGISDFGRSGVCVVSGCSSLSRIIFLNAETKIGNVPSSAIIFGYYGSTAETYANEKSRIFVPLTATTFGDSNLTWLLSNDGVLIISGSGAMDDYSASSPAPWQYCCSGIESVVIENGITTIGDYAFYNNVSITDINIPDSVTSIGGYAFYDCSALTNIDITDGIEEVGDYAFYNCDSLTNVIISENVTRLGTNSFYSCDGLVSVTFLNPAIEIGDSANTIPLSAIIYGYANSTAEAYAEKYDRTFVAFCNHNYTDIIDEKYLVSKDAQKAIYYKSCSECGVVNETETFEVTLYIIGDLNNDNIVNDDDVTYLLYHTFFPDTYPVTQDVDFNNDGVVDDDDVTYLLYHTFFPDVYPID